MSQVGIKNNYSLLYCWLFAIHKILFVTKLNNDNFSSTLTICW